jgi:hypothetical protein
MEPGESRVAAGRSRALAAKTVLGAGALGAFAIFALLARSSHAASSNAGGGSSSELRTPSSLLSSLDQGSQDDFESGQIAPPSGEPQASTGTS